MCIPSYADKTDNSKKQITTITLVVINKTADGRLLCPRHCQNSNPGTNFCPL